MIAPIYARKKAIVLLVLAALSLGGCAAMSMKEWNTDPPSMAAADIPKAANWSGMAS